MLDATLTKIAGREALRIRGEVGYENAASLWGALLRLLARGQRELVVDLSAVDYLDGGGVHALLGFADILPPGGRILLVDPSPNARRILELAAVGSAGQLHIASRPWAGPNLDAA